MPIVHLPSTSQGGIVDLPQQSQGGTVDLRSADYDALIRRTASQIGVDPNQAVTLAKFESGLNPSARSSAGALGLMQVMPQTGQGMGYDVSQTVPNIEAGLRHWKADMARYKDPRLAYAYGYNPGYKGAGPFGAAPLPSPAPAPAPAYVPFSQRVKRSKAAKAQKPQTPGFGQWISNIANAPGIRQVGDIARGIGNAEEAVQHYWQQHPIMVPLPRGHGIRVTPQFAAPPGVNPEMLFPNPLDVPRPLTFSKVAQPAEQIAAKTAGAAEAPHAAVQTQLPLTRTIHEPGGLGIPTEQPVPRRITVRQMRPGIPVRPATEPHPSPTTPVESPVVPRPSGGWGNETQQAQSVDKKSQELFGHIAAVRARGLGYLESFYNKGQFGQLTPKLLPEQERELTNLLHSPESPLITGKWPGYIDASMQRAITDQHRQYVSLWQQNRGVDPATVKLATGHTPDPVPLNPDGTPHFPRMNVKQALKSEDIAGLRGVRRRVGPRRYYAATIDGQEQVVVVKRGDAFKRNLDGTLTHLGPANTLDLHTASPDLLRQADATSVINNPAYVLNQRVAEQEWIAATQSWKADITSGRYPDLVQPATSAPENWVEAPVFGDAWKVNPLLKKVLDRVEQGRTGQARWNVLNNLYVSTWFRTFPWGHNYNIVADAAAAVPFERTQLLAKGELGNVLQSADREVNEFGPKYQRALELGMAPQHITVQSRRILSVILKELGQDPKVRGGLLGHIWGKWGDYQESIPWVADAKARMKVILILEKTGVPFDDAVHQANELIANYWLPSFYAAPARNLQPLYNVVHAGFTNPNLTIFSPYHGTRLASTLNMLKGQLGVRGYTAIAASLLSTQLVQRILVPGMAVVAASYWRNKAQQATTKQARQEAQFQERRWSRLHVSMPGRAGMLENIGTGLGMLGSAVTATQGEPIGERLNTLGAVARPAAQYMARGVLTPSPALAGAAQAYDVVTGNQPVDLNAVNPLQRYMRLAGDTAGEQALAAVSNQLVRAYPRYYLPSEYVAANFAKRFIQSGAKYKIPKTDIGVLRNLHLIAGRDLFRQGLLKPGITPEMYADRMTRFETHRTIYPYQRGTGGRMPQLETR